MGFKSGAKPKSEHKRRGRPPKVRTEPDPGDPPKLSKLEEEEARRQRREERATIKRLEAEERIRVETERIKSGNLTPVSVCGPKPYDWQAVYLRIYRLTKSTREALVAAGVEFSTASRSKREDPAFAAALAEIAEEITEERIAGAEIIKDGLFEAASGVGTVDPFGKIDPARVASAKLWLQAYDASRFGERLKVDSTVSLALPGALLQAISVAAGNMMFEALPEAQATVVETETW